VQTKALLDDPRVPAIYESALTYDDVAVRADILARQRMNEFDLIEVKSTGSWKGAASLGHEDVRIRLSSKHGHALVR
jgi:hypothetical protein